MFFSCALCNELLNNSYLSINTQVNSFHNILSISSLESYFTSWTLHIHIYRNEGDETDLIVIMKFKLRRGHL